MVKVLKRKQGTTNNETDEDTKAQLKRVYYDPKSAGSFSGNVTSLKRSTGHSRGKIRTWLEHQDAYTLHKPLRRKFVRRSIVVGGIDEQWQADLVDVRKLKKYNDGFQYILTIIDVLSKYAWVLPLENKTGSVLVNAFEKIFSQGRKPVRLQTDKGSEFTNKTFRAFLKKEGVIFFTTENEDIKASIAERFNRTLKERLWRYFTRSQNLRYVDVLQPLTDSYNHTVHRSIKRAPAEVDVDNQEEVWQTLYGVRDTRRQHRLVPTFKVNDRVRINKSRSPFAKSCLGNWSEELFNVTRVNKTHPFTYVITDDNGDEIKGSFYRQELQRVGQRDVYRIEKILKQRHGKNREKEYLVKWSGWPATFNSWVRKRDIEPYTN